MHPPIPFCNNTSPVPPVVICISCSHCCNIYPLFPSCNNVSPLFLCTYLVERVIDGTDEKNTYPFAMIYPVDFDDRITKNTPTTWSVFGAERFDKNTEDSYRYKKLIVFIYLCVTPVSKEVKICCSLELTELRPLPLVYQLFNVVSPQSRFS